MFDRYWLGCLSNREFLELMLNLNVEDKVKGLNYGLWLKKIVFIENNLLYCENLIEFLKIEFWYNGWYGEGVYKIFVFIWLFIIYFV